MKNLQVIDRKNFVFRVNNSDYQFVKPNFLHKSFGIVVKGTVKGSTLGWQIEGDFFSYNKMKELFKK